MPAASFEIREEHFREAHLLQWRMSLQAAEKEGHEQSVRWQSVVIWLAIVFASGALIHALDIPSYQFWLAIGIPSIVMFIGGALSKRGLPRVMNEEEIHNRRQVKVLVISTIAIVVGISVCIYHFAPWAWRDFTASLNTWIGRQPNLWNWLVVLILPHAFWTAMMLFERSASRRAILQLTQDAWQRIHGRFHHGKVQWDDSGIEFDFGLNSRRYAWLGIAQSVEGPNIVLLYPGDSSFEIIVKDALGESLESLRQYLQGSIASAQLENAFPVKLKSGEM